MKKVMTLLVGFLLFINAVSAYYNCSNDIMRQDLEEIRLHESRPINGINIGLLYADESSASGKYYSRMMIDSVKFFLNEIINSTEVNMKSGKDTISLVNITSNRIEIKVDGDSKVLGVQEVEEINKRKIYLTRVEGSYPGNITVEGILGKEEIILNNNVSIKIVTVESIDYLLELFSASDNNTILIVKRCLNENAKIVKIADEVIGIPVIQNETIVENVTEDSNKMENVTENSNEVENNETRKSLFERIFIKTGPIISMQESDLSLIILVVVIIIGFIVLWIFKVLSSMQPQIQNIGK